MDAARSVLSGPAGDAHLARLAAATGAIGALTLGMTAQTPMLRDLIFGDAR
ncbi:MAG: hypothetical protein ABI629_06400 [bacterium]